MNNKIYIAIGIVIIIFSFIITWNVAEQHGKEDAWTRIAPFIHNIANNNQIVLNNLTVEQTNDYYGKTGNAVIIVDAYISATSTDEIRNYIKIDFVPNNVTVKIK